MQAKEAKTIETMTAGPAPREPFEPTAAIPNAVNIPEPIITPIPSIIRSKALRVFLSPPCLELSSIVSGFFTLNIFFVRFKMPLYSLLSSFKSSAILFKSSLINLPYIH